MAWPEAVVAGILGLLGAAWGYAADRIAARWPAHEDGSVRSVDWRTAVVVAVGAVALAALGVRFAGSLVALVVLGGYFLALVLLLATDLDQRLLPDVVTLPLVPAALAVGLLGANPLVAGQIGPAVAAAVGLPVFLYVASLPFGAGAIGMGDLKLLLSVGLVAGLGRAVVGLVAGALLAGVVVLVLLLARRVTLRAYIPFGPFLILGAMWGIVVPA